MQQRIQSLAPGEVRVQIVDCAVTTQEAADLSRLLSPAERERAARFVRVTDAHRWIAARAGLRGILAAYTGVPAAAVSILTGEHGKPYIDAPLHFNLSHSGTLALVALAADHAVGIDIESVRPDLEPLLLAEHVFTPAERERLQTAAPPARDRLFLHIWTAKEAFLKALGTGLSVDPATVTVGAEEPGGLIPVSIQNGASGEARRIPGLPLSYVAAVAILSDGGGLPLTVELYPQKNINIIY